MSGKFGDLSTATRMRDVMASIVRRTLAHERPADAYGTVVTIDHTNRKCTVLLAGSTSAVTVSMGTIRPSVVGETVRISGAAQDRYVSEVVQGPGYLDVGALGEWKDYGATVIQSVVCNMEPGISRYCKIGRTVHVQYSCRKSSTGTGTAGQPVRVSLPFVASDDFNNGPVGSGYIYDGSAALFYVGASALWDTDEVGLFMGGAIGGGVWLGSANFTAALVYPDWIRFSATYEALLP